jgi:hypothetical protein
VVSLTDNFRVEWVPDFIFALGWLVLVLSLGAVSLLNMADPPRQRGESRQPVLPGAALHRADRLGLFDETLAGMALVGMALAVWGVYLARK